MKREREKNEKEKEKQTKTVEEGLLCLWDVLPPGMETRQWCWICWDLERQQDKKLLSQASQVWLNCWCTEARVYRTAAHLYCTSLSIKHITDPNKAFQWSPIMTIHSIDLLQLHSWYAIVLDRFTLFSPPGFLFVCLKSSVSFSCFLIIKYSKYIS